MQIPILNGIYTDAAADFRTSYPRNMVPVPKQQGLSNGYLRPADGIISFGDGPGIGRGGINWNDVCYRVMGTKLVSIDSSGVTTVLGDVGGSGQVALDYSFDRLGIVSNGRLYYWNGISLDQVIDVDVGIVVDLLWIDGYFMTTDGENLIVTELNNPLSVEPLKYGSSEVDPDRINGLLKLRDEAFALNRYTIEAFENIGGNGFPFQRISGAQIQKGILGTFCADIFADAIAFLGSGRNEAPAVYIGNNGQAVKISTREIDQILLGYDDLSETVVETRLDKGHQSLLIHLPDRTLCYDLVASTAMGEPVWYILTSSVVDYAQYRGKNLVWCYNKWLCEDPQNTKHGYLSDSTSTHWGETTGWDFGTTIIYNDGQKAICHDLELVCLTGRVTEGSDPVIWTSASQDGVTWGQERSTKVGSRGNRNARIRWWKNGIFHNWRIQKFRGTSDAFLSIARLEAKLEPLNV